MIKLNKLTKILQFGRKIKEEYVGIAKADIMEALDYFISSDKLDYTHDFFKAEVVFINDQGRRGRNYFEKIVKFIPNNKLRIYFFRVSDKDTVISYTELEEAVHHFLPTEENLDRCEMII